MASAAPSRQGGSRRRIDLRRRQGAAQPGGGAKDYEWCFDRDQGAQLCEKTEAECNKLRELNSEIAHSSCRQVYRAAAEPGAADANATIAGGPRPLSRRSDVRRDS
jgi:hypothetical protein